MDRNCQSRIRMIKFVVRSNVPTSDRLDTCLSHCHNSLSVRRVMFQMRACDAIISLTHLFPQCVMCKRGLHLRKQRPHVSANTRQPVFLTQTRFVWQPRQVKCASGRLSKLRRLPVLLFVLRFVSCLFCTLFRACIELLLASSDSWSTWLHMSVSGVQMDGSF